MAFNRLIKYSEMVMFSHTLFSLPFAVMSVLWAGNGLPRATTFIWILIALFAARNGANAFNRVIDSEIDGRNPRTSDRHIPSGIIKKKEAIALTFILFLIFEIAAYMINPLCFFLSPAAIFIFLFYSYTKRFTSLSHLVLGIACGGAPVGGWIAVTGKLSLTPFIIGGAVAFWIAGFDIIYATQDIEFDRKEGLFSIPAKFGLRKSLKIAAFFHVLSIIILIILRFIISTGFLYDAGILICAALLLVEHKIVKPANRGIMNWASYHINQIISIVFFIFSLADFIL